MHSIKNFPFHTSLPIISKNLYLPVKLTCYFNAIRKSLYSFLKKSTPLVELSWSLFIEFSIGGCSSPSSNLYSRIYTLKRKLPIIKIMSKAMAIPTQKALFIIILKAFDSTILSAQYIIQFLSYFLISTIKTHS